LKTAAAAVAGLSGGLALGASLPGRAAVPPRAVIGIATNVEVFDGQDRLIPQAVDALLNRALAGALGAPDGPRALAQLFFPNDVVGIKINCLAGRGLSTHAELVDAVIGQLVKAGVRTDNILVWDRSDRDLTRGRYKIRRSGAGPLYLGTNDEYENEPIDAGSVGGCLSRLLTHRMTALINIPVVKDHDLAGISGALKSFYGAIHNPNKYHDNACSPYIADLYAHPAIRSKARLTIFDGLMPQFQGGPAYVPDYAFKLGSIFVSTDPVAADAMALRIITDRRNAAGLESLGKAGRAPAWLHQAALLGLGTDDWSRIAEVKL